MMAGTGTPSPEVTFEVRPNGWARVQVLVEDEQVSSLEINPYTLRVGRATVRMDGQGLFITSAGGVE
jgi:hypothetical protein